MSIDRLFVNPEVPTDYHIVIMFAKQVHVRISCWFAMLCGHFSQKFVCGHDMVFYLPHRDSMSRVDQEEWESTADN